jgi:hypothetical protein
MTVDHEEERLWERGWEGHAAAQQQRMARLPLPEKLAWLEEAHRLVLHLRRAQAGGPPRTGTEQHPPAPLGPPAGRNEPGAMPDAR